MFLPVVTIIRSLSFDIHVFKIILYKCAAAGLMGRSQYEGLCLSILFGVWVKHIKIHKGINL